MSLFQLRSKRTRRKGLSSGEGVEVVGRDRLTQSKARQEMIKEMIIMRSFGYTDSEIAIKYRYHRVTVNRLINSAPDDVKERLRQVGLV